VQAVLSAATAAGLRPGGGRAEVDLLGNWRAGVSAPIMTIDITLALPAHIAETRE